MDQFPGERLPLANLYASRNLASGNVIKLQYHQPFNEAGTCLVNVGRPATADPLPMHQRGVAASNISVFVKCGHFHLPAERWAQRISISNGDRLSCVASTPVSILESTIRRVRGRDYVVVCQVQPPLPHAIMPYKITELIPTYNSNEISAKLSFAGT